MTPVETPAKPSPSGAGRGPGGTRIGTGEQPDRPRGGGGLVRALLRALPWALGAALGVAAGAYLTAVSGAGAPGAEGIEPGTDLVALPALAFAAMLVAHLALQAVATAVRRRRPRMP